MLHQHHQTFRSGSCVVYRHQFQLLLSSRLQSMDAAGTGRDPVFPVQQIPMLLFPPPLPPPLAAYSSSSSSATSHHPSTTSFPILVLTVLGILTISVLLLTYYVFVIRCCLNWHSSSDTLDLISRRRGRASSSLPVAAVRGAPSEARGLEESAIQALPAFRYRKAINSTVDSSECAVCLSEFQEEERVRLLPSCLHVFHVDCIDTWLQGNANCPLCRAAITTTTTSSCHCQLPLIDQLLRPEEVVIQVVAGTEEEGTQTQQQQEVADSAGHTTADQQASSKKRKNIKPWHDVTSKGDECIEVKRDRDVLPRRRSFSMDWVGRGEVRLQVQKILQNNTHVHGDHSDSSSSSSTL